MEEYFFRVLIQGWLAKVADRVAQSQATTVATTAEITGMEQTWDETSAPKVTTTVTADAPLRRLPLWPVVVSSALFALAHLGHGPAPVPLFVLAMGLGYIYHRTQRILPCIVVHFLVNAFSLVQLWLYLHIPQE